MPRVKDWRRPELGPEPELRTVRTGRRWPWFLFQLAVFGGVWALFIEAPPDARQGGFFIAIAAAALATGIASWALSRFTRRPEGLTADHGEAHGNSVSLPPAAGRGQLSEDNGRLGVRKHLR